MRNYFVFVVAVLCLVSCTAQEDIFSVETNGQTLSSIPTPVITAKRIISDNLYIDVDMDAYNRIIASEVDRENLTESYKAMLERHPEEDHLTRAAWYRYYSHVSLVDSLWVCSAKTAEELNMSERTFRFMDDNVKNINEQAKVARAQGLEVIMPLPMYKHYISE